MTQLEVPTISFTHYLDLLRRRTWHVVIVSVLGLVIGGIVAMLVPRYYVASTTVQLNRPILDPNLGRPVDPMSELVGAAKVTVPAGVKEAVQELGWTDAFAGSAEDQRAYLARVKSRVGVHDGGPHHDGRRIARLIISYRDLSGTRAAAMANELLKRWLADVVQGQKTKAENEVLEARSRRNEKTRERQDAARAVQTYQENHGISPEDEAAGGWDRNRSGSRGSNATALYEIESELGKLKLEVKALERKISNREEEREGVMPRIPADVQELMVDRAMVREYTSLIQNQTKYKLLMMVVTPAHPGYETARASLASVNEKLAEIKAMAGGEASDRANPRHKELSKEIRELTQDKSAKTDRIADLEQQRTALKKRESELPEIFRNYNELRSKLETLEKEEETIIFEVAEKRRQMGQIQPYELLEQAYPPPAPTEPNPYMLALMGCIVGLGVAIGLVLLVDFLQMSFKSVTDVESGLSLPVLGTMSYLETEEEAGLSRDRRRIVTVFSVLFLFLFLVIVTIYYLNKTSLPSSVAGLLDMILGEPK